MKKVLSLILAVLMVFMLLPVSALADGEIRTFLRTFSTVCTFFRINVCDVIYYMYCIRFTYFFTHLTSDTSYGTYAHNVFSFIF